MAKLGDAPKIKFVRESERYIVYLGDDRIGSVKRIDSKTWLTVSARMGDSITRDTRGYAAAWLRRNFTSGESMI